MKREKVHLEWVGTGSTRCGKFTFRGGDKPRLRTTRQIRNATCRKCVRRMFTISTREIREARKVLQRCEDRFRIIGWPKDLLRMSTEFTFWFKG